MAVSEEMLPWPRAASQEYITARQELQTAEQRLAEQLERVARMRGRLPLGAAMPPYSFTEGPPALTQDEPVTSTTLAELVGDRGLFVYHKMYGPDWGDEGCPSCSLWIDGLHGIAHHIAQVVDFVVIAKAPLPRIRRWARRRGWHGLRLLSSYDTTFNLDLGAEDPDGGQWPRVSTFVKRDGVVYHSYTSAMFPNSLDLLSPMWHIEDLLPQGRGDWEPGNFYPRRLI